MIIIENTRIKVAWTLLSNVDNVRTAWGATQVSVFEMGATFMCIIGQIFHIFCNSEAYKTTEQNIPWFNVNAE